MDLANNGSGNMAMKVDAKGRQSVTWPAQAACDGPTWTRKPPENRRFEVCGPDVDQPTSCLESCAGKYENELQPPEPCAWVRILMGNFFEQNFRTLNFSAPR